MVNIARLPRRGANAARDPSLVRYVATVLGVLVLVGLGVANMGVFALSHCNDDAQMNRPGASACGALLGGLGWVAAAIPAGLFVATLWMTRARDRRTGLRVAWFLAAFALPLGLNALLGTFSS